MEPNESQQRESLGRTVLRLLGKGLMRVVTIFSIFAKAGSVDQSKEFMDMPDRPRPRREEYRP